MHKSSLIRQTGIRLGAMTITKSMGLIGRVVLTRIIGAEGIGLFQIAYAYFGFALMLITNGFPTALAIYTAGKKNMGWVWFKKLSIWVLSGGLITAIVTLGFAEQISHYLGNPNSYYFIRALAPALVIIPLLALFRGYLQGLEKYEAIAFSEVFEQLIRVTAMIALCLFFLPQGAIFAGGLSMFGTSLGGIAAFLTLLIFYIRHTASSTYKEVLPVATKWDMSWFVRSSSAIFLTRLLIPFSDMADALIIPARLQSVGYSPHEATALFGMLTGMALLIAYMPTIMTAALSHTITMKLASAWKEQQGSIFQKYSLKAVRYAWSWGIVSTLFLLVFGEELALIIFNSAEPGYLIKGLSLIPLLVGVREITTSILWAKEQKKTTFIATAIGIVFAICCHYFLIPFPYIQLYGAVLGILVMELIVLGANVFALRMLLRPIQIGRITAYTLFFTLSGIPIGYLIRAGSLSFLPGDLGGLLGMAVYGGFLLLVHIWMSQRL
ncbi:oligosaccharide flippase family protein [Paenibacillus illinoisensis]|uniref:oligosaccharide flippase family protein n=1 Tax=Paenibacillus illinoisensis TaxID=59845 RepID=UPI00301C7B13